MQKTHGLALLTAHLKDLNCDLEDLKPHTLLRVLFIFWCFLFITENKVHI